MSVYDPEHDAMMQVRMGALRPALDRIPDDVYVRKNQVGNLSFFNGDGEWLGFLDIYGCELTWFAESGPA